MKTNINLIKSTTDLTTLTFVVLNIIAILLPVLMVICI